MTGLKIDRRIYHVDLFLKLEIDKVEENNNLTLALAFQQLIESR